MTRIQFNGLALPQLTYGDIVSLGRSAWFEFWNGSLISVSE